MIRQEMCDVVYCDKCNKRLTRHVICKVCRKDLCRGHCMGYFCQQKYQSQYPVWGTMGNVYEIEEDDLSTTWICYDCHQEGYRPQITFTKEEENMRIKQTDVNIVWRMYQEQQRRWAVATDPQNKRGLIGYYLKYKERRAIDNMEQFKKLFTILNCGTEQFYVTPYNYQYNFTITRDFLINALDMEASGLPYLKEKFNKGIDCIKDDINRYLDSQKLE